MLVAATLLGIVRFDAAGTARQGDVDHARSATSLPLPQVNVTSQPPMRCKAVRIPTVALRTLARHETLYLAAAQLVRNPRDHARVACTHHAVGLPAAQWLRINVRRARLDAAAVEVKK